jgi:hypothetical protein
MNSIIISVAGILFLIVCVLLGYDNAKIHRQQNALDKYQTIIKTQNDSIETMKIKSTLTQQEIIKAQRTAKSDQDLARDRANIIIRVPEIEDCKMAVSWGAVKSQVIAENWSI